MTRARGTRRDRRSRQTRDRFVGDTDTVAAATSTLGRIAFDQGDYAAARSFLEQSVALFREIGDEPGTAIALEHLGDASQVQGNYERARTVYMESLEIWREVGGKSNVAEFLYLIA